MSYIYHELFTNINTKKCLNLVYLFKINYFATSKIKK